MATLLKTQILASVIKTMASNCKIMSVSVKLASILMEICANTVTKIKTSLLIRNKMAVLVKQTTLH